MASGSKFRCDVGLRDIFDPADLRKKLCICSSRAVLVHQMRGRYSIYTYPSSHTMSILYPSVLYKYHRLRSPQSTCYSTTVFIYFPPSAATPRDTRPDSCKMHPTCPVCSAAMDGPGKTCPSCGAVRYLFLDPFFPVFFATFIAQKRVVIVMKGEKEAVCFSISKARMTLMNVKKNCALCGAISFIFSPHSRSWRVWFLVHVLVYGAVQSKMFFTSSVLRLNLLPAILSC